MCGAWVQLFAIPALGLRDSEGLTLATPSRFSNRPPNDKVTARKRSDNTRNLKPGDFDSRAEGSNHSEADDEETCPTFLDHYCPANWATDLFLHVGNIYQIKRLEAVSSVERFGSLIKQVVVTSALSFPLQKRESSTRLPSTVFLLAGDSERRTPTIMPARILQFISAVRAYVHRSPGWLKWVKVTGVISAGSGWAKNQTAELSSEAKVFAAWWSLAAIRH